MTFTQNKVIIHTHILSLLLSLSHIGGNYLRYYFIDLMFSLRHCVAVVLRLMLPQCEVSRHSLHPEFALLCFPFHGHSFVS